MGDGGQGKGEKGSGGLGCAALVGVNEGWPVAIRERESGEKNGQWFLVIKS